VKFLAKNPITVQGVQDAVERSAEQMFGRFGSAEMKLRLVGLDSASGKGVLRCTLMSVEKLRASVALISQINGQTAMGTIIRSSGTIRGLGVRIPRRQR
jgi:RNase P/RNase MRP subunit POP5